MTGMNWNYELWGPYPGFDQTKPKPEKSKFWRRTFYLFCIILGFYLGAKVGQLHWPTCPCHHSEEIKGERCAQFYTPEQVHLSLGAEDGEYYVNWMTNQPVRSFLIWNKIDLPSGDVNKRGFTSKQAAKIKQPNEVLGNLTNHYAKMNVEPGHHYEYMILVPKLVSYPAEIIDMIDDTNWLKLSENFHTSRIFKFYATDYTKEQLKVIFYGDLGLLNGQSIPRIGEEIAQGSHNLIIHNGDFAYDLDTDNGTYGNDFMKLIEPIATSLPYQTSVGNHEIANNFSHYDFRFTMVNGGAINHGQMNNFYYSFNLGPIHFVAFSTEFYYFRQTSGIEPLDLQYAWLKKDLAHASSAPERAVRPWIIVFGHRPMYCSSRDGDDCSKENNLLRKGLPITGTYALEKLFYDYGVDVEIYAHEHQYERFLPLYDGNVYNGSFEEPYTNALGPVHVISGSAGCQEKLDPFKGTPVTGSVKQISDYGFSRLTVVNKCELKFEQISDDQSGDIVDSFILKKDKQNFPESSNIPVGLCSKH